MASHTGLVDQDVEGRLPGGRDRVGEELVEAAGDVDSELALEQANRRSRWATIDTIELLYRGLAFSLLSIT